MLISICIANYNGSNIIEACVDAVLGQETSVDFEIIVHDDASTDNSVEILERYEGKIKTILSDVNVGFCISNNRMAEMAQGGYILFLNNDTELFEDAIESLYIFTANQHFSGILSLPQYSMENKTLLDRGMVLDPFCNPVANTRHDLSEVTMVMGSCLWISRTLWQQIGGFPEWFETLGEDMYLCLYARILGHKVNVLDNSGYYHWVGHSLGGGKIHDSGRLSTTFRRKAKSERNKTFIMVLFYPWPALIILLPLHIVISIVEGVVLSLAKWDPGIFKNIYFQLVRELLKNSSLLCRERRKIQMAKVPNSQNFFSGFTPVHHKVKMLIKHGLPEIR